MRTAILLLILAFTAPVCPGADEFVSRANDLAAPPEGAEDATPVLFDAIAQMDEPPGVVGTPREAGLLVPSSRGWSEAARWAQGEAQRRVIDSVRTGTERTRDLVFGLGYGRDEASGSWVDAGLFVELGPGGTLAGMDYRYQQRLDDVFALLSIEATRLASEGEGEQAAQIMEASVRLARMIIDREFMAEKRYGAFSLMHAIEKLLDVVLTYPDAFTPEDLATVNRWLDERRVRNERITIPQGNRIAAEQLISATMPSGGGADRDSLARTMREVKTHDHPLLGFGEAAFWRDAAEHHADAFDTRKQLDIIYGDWEHRWQLPDLKDPLLKRLSDYRKMDKRRYLVLYETCAGIEEMFRLRMDVLTEIHGARAAIAVMGFKRRNLTWPLLLPAVQPHFIRELDVDPHSVLPRYRDLRQNTRAFRRFEKSEIFQYFVPIRDQEWEPRQQKVPYEITFSTGEMAEPEGPASSIDKGAIARVIAAKLNEAQQQGGPQFAGEQLDAADIEQMLRHVDFRTLEIDYEGLRATLKEQGSRGTNEQAGQAMTGLFQLGNMFGFTPDTARDKVSQMFDAPPGAPADGPSPFASLEQYGITQDDVKQMVLGAVDALMARSEIKAAFEKVASGNTLSNEEAVAIGEAGIDALITENVLGPVVGAVKKAAGDDIDSLVRAFTTYAQASLKQTKAALDDSVFVLYSVGPDEQDDEARRVVPAWLEDKPAGSDIIIWPPVLTLERGVFAP